jgi:hypothetical protein
MSYDEWQVSYLIRAIAVTYRLVRDDLEKGNGRAVLHHLEQLKRQAEGLYKNYLGRIKQQLLSCDPPTQRLDDRHTDASDERADPGAEQQLDDGTG